MRTAALSLMTTLAIMLIVTANATAEIPWQDNLRSAHAQAQREGKLMLLHFYSDNCTWCDRLEEGSFKAPQVGAAIDKSFVPVKIHANVTPKLAEMFKVSKFPTDVIVTTDGKTLSHAVSPQEPDRYVAMLTKTLPMQGALNGNTEDKRAAVPSTTPEAAIASTATAQVSEPTAVTTAAATSAGNAPVQSAAGYASAANPTAVSQSPTSSGVGFAMPGSSPVKDGVKATFAASRTDSLSLEMPAQSAPTESEASVQAEVEATPESTAAQEKTTIAPSGFVADPEPESKNSFKPDQAELAMQGFCPVTVISEDKWVEGRPEFGVVHLGKLYLFANKENMNIFLADPIPFTPVLNEIDVVRFFEERKIVPGKREWGLKDPIHNRMFFFADEAAMNHFYNEYERYTDAAIEVMQKAVKDANPGS